MSFGGGPVAVDLLNTGQKTTLNKLSGQLNNNIGVAGPQYAGQRVAGTSPLMNMAFGGAAQPMANEQQLNIAIQRALAGAGDPAGVRDRYQAQLAPAQDAFRDALDLVKGQYGSTYGRGGAFDNMIGRAVGDFGNSQNEILANMVYGDRQSAMDRSVQAMNPAVANQRTGLDQLGQQLGFGNTQRAVDQEGLMAQRNFWDEGQWFNNPALQFLNPVLGTQAFGIGQQPGMAGGIGAMLGGLGQLWGGIT